MLSKRCGIMLQQIQLPGDDIAQDATAFFHRSCTAAGALARFRFDESVGVIRRDDENSTLSGLCAVGSYTVRWAAWTDKGKYGEMNEAKKKLRRGG